MEEKKNGAGQGEKYHVEGKIVADGTGRMGGNRRLYKRSSQT